MASRRKLGKVVPAVPQSRFEVGNFVAITHFLKVKAVAKDKLQVADVDKKDIVFDIEGQDLLDNTKSASYFTTTKKVSKTELATLLTNSYNVPFSVNFDKADGSNRTMVGRLVEPEPLLGRSKVFDFEEPSVSWKLCDHRTLHWIIVNGTKYQVK